MAGTEYDMTKHPKIQRFGTVNPGINVLKFSIDFTKTPVNAADDDWKIYEFKEEWILMGGWARNTSASTSAATVDIGTAADGTELDTAVDISTALTVWTAMDTMVVETEIIMTADTGLYLNFNAAAVSDGNLEIMLLVLVEPGNDQGIY